MLQVRTGLLSLLGLAFALSLGACSSARHDSDGTPKATQYPADGYLGITSVNPNDPLNPGYHHYRDDMKMMRSVLSGIPGIAGSTITLNGPQASVALALKPGTGAAEAERIRTQAQNALSFNMPRYDVTVKLRGS